jgi:hypothetical protein
MPLITYAEPHILYAAALAKAVERLEDWLRDPVYK